MIKVRVGSNLDNTTVIVDANRTLKSVLEENEVDFSRGNVHLDGATLKAGDINKTFAEFGIVEKCSLVCVVKADAAATI